jgi:hypothetical protein
MHHATYSPWATTAPAKHDSPPITLLGRGGTSHPTGQGGGGRTNENTRKTIHMGNFKETFGHLCIAPSNILHCITTYSVKRLAPWDSLPLVMLKIWTEGKVHNGRALFYGKHDTINRISGCIQLGVPTTHTDIQRGGSKSWLQQVRRQLSSVVQTRLAGGLMMGTCDGHCQPIGPEPGPRHYVVKMYRAKPKCTATRLASPFRTTRSQIVRRQPVLPVQNTKYHGTSYVDSGACHEQHNCCFLYTRPKQPHSEKPI